MKPYPEMPGEDVEERQFDVAQDVIEFFLMESICKKLFQSCCVIDIFAAVEGHFFYRHIAHGDLTLAFTNEIFDGDFHMLKFF